MEKEEEKEPVLPPNFYPEIEFCNNTSQEVSWGYEEEEEDDDDSIDQEMILACLNDKDSTYEVNNLQKEDLQQQEQPIDKCSWQEEKSEDDLSPRTLLAAFPENDDDVHI